MNPLVHLAISFNNPIVDTPENARRRATLVQVREDARRQRRARRRSRVRRGVRRL